MKILSIESSCDDTGITIMEMTGGYGKASFKILADASNSQIPKHIPFGGVYPALAKKEHAKNLPILFKEVMLESKLAKKEKPVDAVAVTYGPGLEMCLWEGITFAKDLAKKWNVPLIPTNHMEGHIFSVFGKKNIKTNKGKFSVEKVKTPMLSILVSGGHTQLIVSRKWMEYEIIGETLDDAVGEAYDKVARMLGLNYPGGPQISRLAEEMRAKEIKPNLPKELPRPMMHSKDFKFSYSGLKTAVLYLIRDLGGLEKLNKKMISQIALEFENAAIEPIIYKTAKAIEKYNIKTIAVGGGVACNIHLQRELKKLAKIYKVKLLLPQKELTGDNSLMIGIAGYLQYIKNKKKVPKIDTVRATGTLKL